MVALMQQDLAGLAKRIRAVLPKPRKMGKNVVQLMANGDLRLAANQRCWDEQVKLEAALTQVIEEMGYTVVRVHAYDPQLGHGFIQRQRQGLDAFKDVDPDAPLIIAEAVWEYSHHILDGLLDHRGPILIVANWSGTWPGLVGASNLNACLAKFGKPASFLWSEDFSDKWFRRKLKKWLETGKVIQHDRRHVRRFKPSTGGIYDVGAAVADSIAVERPIAGCFDERCMGMVNAVFEDEHLHQLRISREPMSQSALYYETMQVSDAEAEEVVRWWEDRGLTFKFGTDEQTELTRAQVLLQAKMYIAAVRIADDFGCAVIGIQYQQGLKDLLPASDLVEGTLNTTDRPPVKSRDGKRVLFEGESVPCANEVDWGAFTGGLLIKRLHAALGQEVDNTQHDLRWGDIDRSGTVDDYVWVFLLSGSVPASHFPRGWQDASSERQPGMYFRLGGGTLKGVSKPGEGVWHRFCVRNGKLELDIGRFSVVELPEEETERRLQATTYQWPIMHAVLHGITRDQMMGWHKSNHIQVAYCNSAEDADLVVLAFAQMVHELSGGKIKVNLCGTKKSGELLQAA